MTNFVEKMRLHELAEEDIYFRERDLQLIEALRQRQLNAVADCQRKGEQADQAQAFEDRFEALTVEHRGARNVLLRAYRTLLDDIAKVCKHRAKASDD